MRFAIIGCGVIAVTHEAALRTLPEQSLYAVCDIDREKADTFALAHGIAHVYYDYRIMLKDSMVETVCVCTPSNLHAEMTIAAIKAGKSVVCEKPMEVTFEAAREIVKVTEEYRAKVQCILQRRMLPAANAVRQAIRHGAMGRICLAEAHLAYYRDQAYYDSAGWRNVCGGAMLNQGVHGIDLILWMLGEPVETVFGYVETLGRKTGVEDTVAAVLKMKSGALCVIKNTTLAYPEFPTGFVIHGEKATAAFHDLGVQTWEFADAKAAPPHPDELLKFHQETPISLKPYYGNIHAYLLQDLADAVKENREPLVPPRKALTAVRVISDILESAKRREPVPY